MFGSLTGSCKGQVPWADAEQGSPENTERGTEMYRDECGVLCTHVDQQMFCTLLLMDTASNYGWDCRIGAGRLSCSGAGRVGACNSASDI